MSREIKFRVWAETDNGNEMIYLGQLECDNGLWFDSPVEHIDKYIQIMQFTGLKDKNGKEIYEGDLLETKHGNIITVEDLEYIFLWRYENHYAWSSITNIGNLHENPELLNK